MNKLIVATCALIISTCSVQCMEKGVELQQLNEIEKTDEQRWWSQIVSPVENMERTASTVVAGATCAFIISKTKQIDRNTLLGCNYQQQGISYNGAGHKMHLSYPIILKAGGNQKLEKDLRHTICYLKTEKGACIAYADATNRILQIQYFPRAQQGDLDQLLQLAGKKLDN